MLILPEKEADAEPCWFGFIMSVKDGAPVTRNAIMTSLEQKNIQTRPLFAGNITRHPCFETLEEGKDYRIVGSLANTDKTMTDAFWIGVYPGMTKEKLDYMVEALHEAVRG